MINKITKTLTAYALLTVFFQFACVPAFAQSEIDSLMRLLVKKNILSQGESIQILEEANSAAEMQQINAIKKGPSFIANTTFKGDLRLRHQYESKEASSTNPKSRFRTRLRFGFENQLNKNVKVGVRFATGTNTDSGDPRSTNETWSDGFENWKFNVDEAYVDWTVNDNISLIGGKREVNKIMLRNSDLIWDGDLTFDGATLKLEKEVGESTKLFANIGGYILDQEKVQDGKQNKNPFLLSIQPGFENTIKTDTGKFSTKMGIAYLGARNVKHQAKLDAKNAQSNNTTEDGNTNYKYGYDVLNPTLSLEYSWGGSKNDTYAVKLFSDYVYNPDPQDTGFLIGSKLGYRKVGKKLGDWQLGYNWRYLEDDAFLDIFSDSDAYGGDLNIKGHEFTLEVGLAKDIIWGMDLYLMEPISGSTRNTERLVQTDFVFKF